ncbi:MAG: indolepyruvate ferredoxin oxidoreductase family protein [Rhodospirillales bacterium]|nr:indolepyruvate ferredoxin oxidoreductase family protein [Rhodospirillales bacterium]
MTALAVPSLDDRYLVEGGRVYLTGTQALVRLLLEQARRDQAQGLKTGGFVSGYRGSPLGGLDRALWEAQPHLERHAIRFVPAVNEELAATALIGTQQLMNYPGATVEGVFALWYGKGPGLDRASDALKHANSLGSSPKGGGLVVVGDDHGAVSSSLAHQSEPTMASWGMPVLYPTGPRDYIELGLLGFALSRFAGTLVGFKTVAETVESAASFALDPHRPAIVRPAFETPPGGLHNRWPDFQLPQEKRLYEQRLVAARAFARANRIDRIAFRAPKPRLGLVAAGKAWLDLMQALDDLGIDAAKAEELGLAAYKVGMVWPLEPEGLGEFALGLEEIFVIEEKRPFLESQIKDRLYHLEGRRPRVVGKTDETGRALLPEVGELAPRIIALALLARLERLGIAHGLALPALPARKIATGLPIRTPNFCPGCPHSLSVRRPEGSRAFAGTGCHLMAAFVDPATSSLIHMGCEGANWIGQAPFTDTKHVFQNLGDGTYVHSASLAIRQALAAKVNITYKILYNDAVAMTGGQPFEAALTVPNLARQLLGEGVARIALVSDQPDRHADALPARVSRHGRNEFDAVQRQLRDTPGVTILIYDQPCATERRRQIKRGKRAAATRHIVIHPEICENCGDCVVKSGCAALVERPTPFGPKRAVDPAACSQSYACLEGFCPALVSVEGTPKKPAARPLPADASLPMPEIPALPAGRPWRLLVAGIGGTGVVTSGQILGMAAHLDGRAVSVLSFTGLAQKGGGVLAHLQFARGDDDLAAPRIGEAAADALVAGDLVMAASEPCLSRLHPQTRAVVDPLLVPTGAMVRDPRNPPDANPMRRALAEAVGADHLTVLPAAELAHALAGDSQAANLLLVGHAWQSGLIPLGLDALLRAIELNGVAIAANRAAFAWGRHLAHRPERIAAILPQALPEDFPALLARHTQALAAYQDRALAERHRRVAERAQRALEPLGAEGLALATTIARAHYRLLAYKDEYEVARLLTHPVFHAALDARFEPGWRMRVHLAPPFLGLKKREFGPWIGAFLKILAALKGLRGRAFDPFALEAERQDERLAISAYEARIERLLAGIGPDRLAPAVKVAALPLAVRGFGPVRARDRQETEKILAALEAEFCNTTPHAQAAQ